LAVNFSRSFRKLMSGASAHDEQSGARLEEVLIRSEEDASDKIAVIDVEGIITGMRLDGSGVTMPELIRAQFRRAEKDEHVKGVILRVNSPGGEVLASDEINRIVAKFQENTRKPVIASMGNLAASGGYYVSVPCRWIVANELTITGSIGVILSSWNYRSLMDKVGVRPVVYKSGRFKDMLAGDRAPEEIPEGEKAMVQALIDETYQKFRSVVGEGRGNAAKVNPDEPHPLVSEWQSYADGRILTGKQALEYGFVDELGDFDAAINRAKKLAKIRKADTVQYRQVFDIMDLFSLFSKSEARSLKIDMGMDLPKLQSGQPYFLAPTFIH
jgi:protease-4